MVSRLLPLLEAEYPYRMMLGTQLTIPGGDAGTEATLRAMRELAIRASLSPLIRETALRIIQEAAGYETELHPRLVADWVAEHTQFVRDPRYAEALHTPDWMVAQIRQWGIAPVDCDDVALLAAALGLSIGLRARYVAVSLGSAPGAPFQHVWAELASPRGPWLPVDPTRPAQGLDGLPVARSLVLEV